MDRIFLNRMVFSFNKNIYKKAFFASVTLWIFYLNVIVLWTALYNKCLEITNIPKIWRESTVKVVYKGKGSQNTPDSYRGIALECTLFKILNNILLGKIHESYDCDT